jgi:hypothetical protein
MVGLGPQADRPVRDCPPDMCGQERTNLTNLILKKYGPADSDIKFPEKKM